MITVTIFMDGRFIVTLLFPIICSSLAISEVGGQQNRFTLAFRPPSAHCFSPHHHTPLSAEQKARRYDGADVFSGSTNWWAVTAGEAPHFPHGTSRRCVQKPKHKQEIG